MPVNPKDPTAKPRKALERQNKRNQGLVPIELWVKPEHKERIKQKAKELNQG